MDHRDRNPGKHYRYVEAESGTIKYHFVIKTDPTASNGKYLLDEWNEAGFQTDGEARYSIEVPAAGVYYLWGRCRAPSTAADSFFVTVGGGPAREYYTSTNGLSSEWRWTMAGVKGDAGFAPYSYPLQPGTVEIVIRSRESLSTLDLFIITDDLDFVP